MRILYFAPTSTLYGDNIALLNIQQLLISKGIQPYFITSYEGDFTKKLREGGYTYFLQKFYTNLYPPAKSIKDFVFFIPRLLRHLIGNKIYIIKCQKLVKNINPDIIHTNNGLINAGFEIAKRLNIQHVWHIREYGKLGIGLEYFPSRSFFIKKIHQYNNANIYVSKGLLNFFNQNAININSSDNIIYDGVINDKLQIIKPKNKTFLFVGRLHETKGIKELLFAFIKLSKFINDYTLTIIGDGNIAFINELHAKVKNAGITEKIIFLGYKEKDFVYKFMSEAVALIVMSFEGFGFITTEAMYNGCLVIGKNTAGTKEQFDNGLELTGREIGIRYNTEDELIAVMSQVAENGISHYLPMIYRAQKVVQKLYTIEQSAEKVYELYKSILKEH